MDLHALNISESKFNYKKVIKQKKKQYMFYHSFLFLCYLGPEQSRFITTSTSGQRSLRILCIQLVQFSHYKEVKSFMGDYAKRRTYCQGSISVVKYEDQISYLKSYSSLYIDVRLRCSGHLIKPHFIKGHQRSL